jgi:hypothetical protein
MKKLLVVIVILIGCETPVKENPAPKRITAAGLCDAASLKTREVFTPEGGLAIHCSRPSGEGHDGFMVWQFTEPGACDQHIAGLRRAKVAGAIADHCAMNVAIRTW